MNKECRLYGVLHHSIDEIWPAVKPLLIRAIVRSGDIRYHLEDIYKALKARGLQLWVIYDNEGLVGCCITEIICYPRKKVLYLFLISGEGSNNWLHLCKKLKQFAKEQGCQAVEGAGRPGWEKIISGLGFKKAYTVFKHELE